MPSDSSERLEFCSAPWVNCLHGYIERHLAGLDLSGVTMSFSEELTDPPPHLLAEGATSVGWHYCLTDGVLTVEGFPLSEAEYRMLGDYSTIVELARLPYSDPRIGPLAQSALDEGTLRYEGDQSGADKRVTRAIRGLHDYLAGLTA